MAQTARDPASICVNVLPSNTPVERTDIGTLEFAEIPIPNCPWDPYPQQNGEPPAIAHVKKVPTEIEVTVLPEAGLVTVIPGLLIKGNATPLVVKAFAGTANVVCIHGFVNQITV